ncbi:MAG: C2H2-type zinc finger protein [Chloroflexi bacterium]|nr:C2H2-type zinc finger protein [Chloroflexota bacterium]
MSSGEEPVDRVESRQGRRCPDCGAEFATEALLANHRRLHTATGEEREALLDEQAERRP